jgi:hypothetical protein
MNRTLSVLLALFGGLSATEARADRCTAYGIPALVAEVDAPIEESSGLAMSSLRAGVLFTHDDHGGEAALVSIDTSGNLVGQHVVAGADNEDWEDLAAAPCPDKGSCLYIGDIGDNDLVRPNITIWVVPEPTGAQGRTSVSETWTGQYPGASHDAEALLVHPCTGDVHLLSVEPDGSTIVWRWPNPEDRSVSTLRQVAVLSLDTPVASASWDQDGDTVALLGEGGRVWTWEADPQDPEAHWQDEPIVLEAPVLDNPEALAIGALGDLWVSSEGSPMPLGHVPCEERVNSDHPCNFPQEASGCCGGGKGSSSALVWLVPPLFLWRRRRRRQP